MRRGAVLLAGLLLALLLGACGATTAPEEGAVRQLSAAEAVAELPSRVVIDVRTPAETAAEGMVAGATNIDFQAPDFRARVGALDRNGRYLVYCRTGNRSAQAAAVMAELGFTDVIDAGGFSELVAAGAPVEP